MMQLESLANELLLDLFEFFDSIHLLQSFIGLNSRFNQLLYSHFRTHQFNLQSLSKEHFHNICDKHLPLIIDQITSFRLSDDETPNLSTLLFSCGFTLDRFICLQSLSLYNIYSFDTLHKIICQCRYLPHLTHLNIIQHGHNAENYGNMVDLFDKIWTLSQLRHCNLNGLQTTEISLRRMSTISSCIEYLSIENIPCNLNCLSHICKHTPCLKQLCATIYSYSLNDHLTFVLSSIKFLKLVFGGLFDSMHNLLENMPNLSHLMIATSQVYFDGNAWKELISHHLTQIKIFQLKMEIEYRENNNDIEEIIDELLLSFQTSFWLEERQWYVRCHWNPSDPYKWVTLYTLPYAFRTFDYSNKSSMKSTCFNQQQYWSYDRVEIFTHGSIENTPLDSFSLLHARFPNIHHLHLNLPFPDQFWSHFPSLNHLTSLNISLYKYSGYYQLQTLLHQAPHLYSLKVQSFIGLSTELFNLTSQSIRRLDLIDIEYDRSIYYNEEDCISLMNSSLGIQSEVLLIRIKHRTNVADLIEKMSNLRLLICESEDDNDFSRNNFSLAKNELVRWLQDRLPSTYTITRHPRQLSHIHIWINRATKQRLSSDSYILSSNHKKKLSRVFKSFQQLFSSAKWPVYRERTENIGNQTSR